MKTYFRKSNSGNDSEELILFFCGWGMDEKPFQPLKSSADILFFYDYIDADPKNMSLRGAYNEAIQPLFELSKNYKRINLIAFSYGVFMAGLLRDYLPKFDLKIAVNGTLKPVDDEFGIPHKIFTLTLENMTELTALKFREKLFSDKNELYVFNKNLPDRDMQSSKNELAALKKYFLENKDINFEFDKIIIGENDRIIPPKNQKAFWQEHSNVNIMDGGHFLFYKFNSFNEIIDD